LPSKKMVVTVLESMFGAMKRSVGCVSKLAALLNEAQLRGVVLSAVMLLWRDTPAL